MITLTCDWCGVRFERRLSDVMNKQKNGRKNWYCTQQCWNRCQRGGDVPIRICEQCGISFQRPLRNSDQRRFCSLSCAASYNNQRRPKKERKIPTCNNCGRTKSASGTQCRTCLRERFTSRTLGELRATNSTLDFHRKARTMARSAYKGPWRCAACGYSLHVDICHVRGIADWPPEATLGEVNAPSNLIALDKRCHWEFDNGYLIYRDGRFISAFGEEAEARQGGALPDG